MLKLHQLFFRRFALFLIAIFVAGAALGYVLLRQMEIETHERMLRQTLFLLERDLETLPPETFASRIRALREATGIRVTVITPEGRVRFESDRDPAGMENHADRPEIREAGERGKGRSVRRSLTLGTDLLYVVQRTPRGYLRLAYSLEAINDQLLALWLKALIFLAAVLGVLFLLSVRLHRCIDRDMEILRDSLGRLLKKEFDRRPGRIRCCREMEEIGIRIRKLAKKLAKRERQKAKYTRKLKSLTQRQSDIISAISHEFKNPVAAIMGYAQSLRETEKIAPETRKRFLEKIEANAEKISLMIDRLSLAIKLENRSFQPRKSRFDLSPVVHGVRETLLQKYRGRQVRIECGGASICLEADRDMVEHLLLNLVENALKYSEGEVTIRCTRNRLEVADRGVGIEASELEKITRRFYRVDRLSWNNSIGVGLYIVKYILKLHGTELEIRSVPGEGSVFGFSLERMRCPGREAMGENGVDENF
jgi:signal transduction histidine kinase